MSLLKNLSAPSDVQQETDVLGGGGGTLETNIYKLTITLPYLEKSAGGALGLNVHFKTESGRDLRQTFWMTSGDDKGNKTYYENKNGEKQFLPGFTLANSLALLTVGEEITDLEDEEKTVPLWNYEAKAEVATKVPVITALIGKEIYAGVFKNEVDKTAKNDEGVYVPTGETRLENEVDKFFRARDKLTTAEIRAQKDEAVFFDQWLAKWEGTTRNRTAAARGGNNATPAGKAPGATSGNGSAAAKPSLFK